MIPEAAIFCGIESRTENATSIKSQLAVEHCFYN